MSHGYHAIFFNTSVLLLSIPINLIDCIRKSLLVLEIHILLEMFDISYLFPYDDPFYPPRIICCPNLSRSIKDYSPSAVSHGFQAIFFNTKVFRCYPSQLSISITLNYPIKKSLSVLQIQHLREMFDISYHFRYDDLLYLPRIICCLYFSRSIKENSPRAVSHGYHAIFSIQVFCCYRSKLT